MSPEDENLILDFYMQYLDILIVGGGLGGLATAIALKQKGHNVTVLEGAAKLGEIGAGIQVPPNSVRHLKLLGIYDKVLFSQSLHIHID